MTKNMRLNCGCASFACTFLIMTTTRLMGLTRAFTRSSRRQQVYPLSTKLYSTDSDTARVLFLGTPDVAATCLRTIVEDSQKESSAYSVVGVVTQPPKRRKRKGKEIPSPVGYAAQDLDIPVLTPEKVRPSHRHCVVLKCHNDS